MKRHLFLLCAAAFLVALFAFSLRRSVDRPGSPGGIAGNTVRVVLRCGTDWTLVNRWIGELDIPPIPGAGTYQWKISTASDSAQFYFNQGINMYYSFHIIEAMASFKKAAKFDPGCAMMYWAQALCYGPNINDFGYRASPEALQAVDDSKERAGSASSFEQALINAMAVRYTADSADATRAQLNGLYTEKMRKVYQDFPGNADAQALYADAMMLQHPWDLWKIDGTPKPWTPAIRKVLEDLLATTPDHPGANHYYIHVMEPSPYAEKALASADRLGRLTPGLAHTVHMPSHIYLRTGRYDKGVSVNDDAINSYEAAIPLYPPVAGADFLYAIHSRHMHTNNAFMTGDGARSAASALETLNSIPKEYYDAPAPVGNFVQYVSMTPMFVNIRFGKWEDIINIEKPASALPYSNLLYHFGRGLAFTRRNELKQASLELDRMREWMKDSSLLVALTPFSPAIDAANVAEEILLGMIHEQRGLYEGAIRHYSIADSIEINMVYNEPRDWLLSPKHYLGNAYLLKGDYKEAEKIFRKDLLYNQDNVWSLRGLHSSLEKQRKHGEARAVLARFNKAAGASAGQVRAAVY